MRVRLAHLRQLSIAAAIASGVAVLCGADVEAAGPLVLPGAVRQTPAPAHAPAAERTSQPPAQEKPASGSLTGNAIDRPLSLNGAAANGQLTVTVLQPGMPGLRLHATGRAISDPAETCAITMGGDAPVPMLLIEEPYTRTRYRLQSPACPLVIELLENSARVSLPDGECRFLQADCLLAPTGVWGPQGEELVEDTRAIERRRGKAERDMRDISRRLLRRLKGDAQRDAAAEQAGFSSERAILCRDYALEDQHGFCAAELTAARVTRLNRHLELTPEPPKKN